MKNIKSRKSIRQEQAEVLAQSAKEVLKDVLHQYSLMLNEIDDIGKGCKKPQEVVTQIQEYCHQAHKLVSAADFDIVMNLHNPESLIGEMIDDSKGVWSQKYPTK